MFADSRLQVLARKWIETARKPKTIKWCSFTKIPANSRRYCHFYAFLCVIYRIRLTHEYMPLTDFADDFCLIGPNIWQHGHLIKLRN